MRVDHLVARSYLSSSGGWTTRQLDKWTSSEGQIVCGCDGDEKQLKRSTKVLKGESLKIILVTIKMYCFNDDDDAYHDVGGVIIVVGWWCWR